MKHLPFIIIAMIFIVFANASMLRAHPAPLAQARLQIDTAAAKYELHIDCDVTAFVMGHGAGHLTDDLAAQLASLSDEQLATQVDRVREWFATQLEIVVDGRSAPVEEVIFPSLKTIRKLGEKDATGQVRTAQSTIVVSGKLSAKSSAMPQRIIVRLPREIGPALLVIRRDSTDLPVQLLAAGQPSAPIALREQAARGLEDDRAVPCIATHGDEQADGIPPGVITTGQFLALGFWHIIPDGPDHILFVLGLFLLSAQLKPLLWQVTAFTLAHSVTLALAMYGFVRLPAEIVEPLIAASIAFIAIENLFTTRLQPWRPILVFAFGLLHGLGFAGVLSDLSLPAGQFAPAIVGFNIGVEVGQLAVLALAFAAVGWLREWKHYRSAIIIPASLAIAVIGIYWTIQRLT